MNTVQAMSHLTRGAWIEISQVVPAGLYSVRRTSHEVRGLKFYRMYLLSRLLRSHLTRGAWIEIYISSFDVPFSVSRTSHEVRGLKYSPAGTPAWLLHVAPHTRCVD